MIHNLYKERGETPLECIERFKIEKFKDFGDQKMTYLGRLDPLAEGVLLVGSGDEDTKQVRREEFFGLDKEYEFVALFGFATDTYDVMGKITHPLIPSRKEGRSDEESNISEMDLIKVCKLFEGEREQEYPKYSSKMISLKNKKSPHPQPFPEREGSSETPLLRGGERGGVKKINIYKLEFKKLDKLSKKELFGRLLMDISKVKGDFRQDEVLALWQKTLEKLNDEKILLAHFSAHVSSGTYIRGIVNDLGKTLGIGATTLSIKRNRVGDYKIEDSLRF